jgi:hypothetical protein
MMMSRVGDDSEDNNNAPAVTSIASNDSNDDICVERRGRRRTMGSLSKEEITAAVCRGRLFRREYFFL